MKILVTGAAGFIGSNLTERLVKEGHEVTALDTLHTGKEENLAAVKGKIKFVKMKSGDVAKLNENFDAILHQGIYSSSPMYKANPLITAEVLSEWISILEYVRKRKEAGAECKLVYASSSSVYNGNKPPHHEDMPIHVTDFYTEGRFEMERLAKLHDDFYGVNSVGLRYFSVYGPHERSKGQYANLITQFLWDMQKGKAPLVFGDGSQTRDFTYVDDVVDANLLALKYPELGVFNVGTGKNVTINEMIAMLNRQLGKSIKAEYKPNKIKNYVQETLADTKKAETKLGFKAKVSLELGIERLIRAYS